MAKDRYDAHWDDEPDEDAAEALADARADAAYERAKEERRAAMASLGRRYLKACEALGVTPWRAGMETSHGRLMSVTGADDPHGPHVYGQGWGYEVERFTRKGAEPDFDDPATLGCLVAVVREVWGGSPLSAEWSHVHDAWVVLGGTGNTEAEAWVAALEGFTDGQG